MYRRFSRFSCFFCLFLLLFSATNVRPQTDRTRQTAEKLQAEAEELFSKNTPEDRVKAAPKFAEALKLWEQLGDDANQIKTLNRLNDIAFSQSDYRQTISLSTRVLTLAQKIGDKNVEGGALGNIGFYYNRLGESRKGLEYLEKSAAILSQISEKQRESVVLGSIGATYYNLGDIKTALDFFNRSLKLKRETGDRRGEAILLTNLGYAAHESGDTRRALEYYEEALKLSIETGNQDNQGTVLGNIGSVYQDLSEFQKAFDFYRQALELQRKIGDKYGVAVSMQNIASLYRTFGDFDGSLNFLNQSLEVYRENKFRSEEALILSSIGAVYSLKGDKTRALEFYVKALEMQRSVDNKSAYALILGNMGSLYLDKGEYQKALETFTEALKYAEESQDVDAAASSLLYLARAEEKLGKIQSAETNFMRAAAIYREIGMPNDLADTLYYSARFEDARGNRTAAIEKITEALGIIENSRAAIASQTFRSSFLAEQQKFYDLYISMLAAQHKQFPDKGFGALALQASEKARARSLLDSLGETRRNIRSRISPALPEEERLLRQTINAKDYQRVEAAKLKSKTRVAELEKELADALRQYAELQTKIRQASPEFASLSNPEPLSLPEIQSRVLDENSVLLEYFLGEDRSFLFLVSQKTLDIIELPKRETIENPVRQTIENLKARAAKIPNETYPQRTARFKTADAAAEKLLAEVSRTLISPVAAQIQNKRLLIVASGILHYLPFAALSNAKVARTVGTGKQTPATSSFLIETNEIIYLPSASVLPLLRENKNRQKQPKNLIAILADPVFSADDSRLKPDSKSNPVPVMSEARIILPNLRSDFSRLEESRKEASAISELALSGERFLALDFAANLSAVTSENLRSSRIVHLATHGTVNSQFPELSSIVLSLVNEKGKPQEGLLRLQDVYNLRLDADLVVLSACETALGKEIKGEGIIGLTRGFMYAGAPSVVASLWKVEDSATAELMMRFYRRMLKEKLPPSAALREAQIAMLKEVNTAHPFFWAGFTLQGDWKN